MWWHSHLAHRLALSVELTWEHSHWALYVSGCIYILFLHFKCIINTPQSWTLTHIIKTSLSSSKATKSLESTALLSSNHLQVATSTSRPRSKALGGHKYIPMSWNNSQEFNWNFENAQDCSMCYLKVFPLTHLHPLHSLQFTYEAVKYHHLYIA